MLTVLRAVHIPSGTSPEALYRELGIQYPKFFKMDLLSRLGFLLGELVAGEDTDRFTPREDRAVLIFSRNGCYCNDTDYAASMEEYPSPALFVYTLPNIVTGELAIRNKYAGETGAYVLEAFDPQMIVSCVEQAFHDRVTSSALCGWVDCRSENDYDAVAFLVERDGDGKPFNTDFLYGIFDHRNQAEAD